LEDSTTTRKFAFLRGEGEMHELTHNFNWLNTSVGLPNQWPQPLRTTVSNLLRSKFPMFLWWGDEMIQFYNDAYRPSLGNNGKHPKALGQKGKECWPEIWQTITPLLDQVRTTGEGTWMEDQLVPIYRNGELEDVYWTFSYSSVVDDEGKHCGILVTCTETTQKVISQKKLTESEKLLRNTIHQAPVAICIFRGHELIIEEANELMFKFWGKSSQQVMDKPLFEAIPESTNQGYEELLENVFKTGNTFSANELPVTLPRNGEIQTVFINFTYTPIVEINGAISGIMAMATDVTEQVLARIKIEDLVRKRTFELAEANNALHEANHKLERLNQNLEEFAYAASHDLKEPIRKIRYFGDRIKISMSDRITEDERRHMARMENASLRMDSLIDDLLTYSRVSVMPDSFKEVDLTQLLQTVIEDLDLLIEEERAVITTEELCIVTGHQRQLQQAFHNLLGNAIKYKKPDTIPHVHINCLKVSGNEVNVDIPEHEQQQTFYHIKVQDNGIGFEQENAERIFNVFTRLHGTSQYLGAGIGLSIVRKVVDNHKGHVWAESKPGEGSTFNLLLPAG
jgi:PAS domain S-box-containing protein